MVTALYRRYRPETFAELIGQSPIMRELFRSIGRVAATDLNVLVIGATGTGKELVARALHRHSARAAHAFVAMNPKIVPRIMALETSWYRLPRPKKRPQRKAHRSQNQSWTLTSRR